MVMASFPNETGLQRSAILDSDSSYTRVRHDCRWLAYYIMYSLRLTTTLTARHTNCALESYSSPDSSWTRTRNAQMFTRVRTSRTLHGNSHQERTEEVTKNTVKTYLPLEPWSFVLRRQTFQPK